MTFNLTNLILTSILIANLIFAIVVVFIERKRPSDALVWLLLFAFLPVLGFVLYMFIGQKLLKQKKFRLKKEDDQRLAALVANQQRHLDRLREELTGAQVPGYIGLVHMNVTKAAAPVTQANEVTIFTHGEAKFADLLRDIEAAKSFIHMEYFIFRGDNLGRQLVDALAAKAGEGVEVRLILDDWGCKLTPNRIFQPLVEAGGKVHRFLPVTLAWAFNANYRNHRKIVVIDGVVGYTGGINVGDEYLGLRKRMTPWRDTHVRLVGPAVVHLESRFLMDWIYVAGEEVAVSERYLPHESPSAGESPIQIVSSGPDSDEPHVKQGYLKMINLARERLYLQTPYLVPDESILEALKVAAFSGVDVRVMIPAIPDRGFVHKVTMAYAGELLEAGVKVYLYKGFLHSKALVVDGQILSIGTANLDVRSFALNFEVNAFIYDSVKAQEYCEIFEADQLESDPLTLEVYRQRGLWQKLTEGIWRLLAPLL